MDQHGGAGRCEEDQRIENLRLHGDLSDFGFCHFWKQMLSHPAKRRLTASQQTVSQDFILLYLSSRDSASE